jgi:hypothetical protein
MAAAVANRPRNHAHQPDAAAAVDQADAPPHLRVAAREKATRTTLTYQELKKIPRKQRRGQASRRTARQAASSWRAGRARRAELHAAMYYARTHQLVAELERGVREHLPVPGAAAAEDADRAEPARHGGRSVAHVEPF